MLLSAALTAAAFRVTAYCFNDSSVVEVSKGVRVVGLGELMARVSAAHVSLARQNYDLVVVSSELNSISSALQVSRNLLAKDGLGIVLLQPSPLALHEASRLGVPVAAYLALYTCVWRSNGSNVEWIGEGTIRCAGKGDACRAMGDAARRLGLNFEEKGEDSIEPLVWDLFAATLAVQPVSALLGVGFAALRRSSHAVQLVESLAGEAELVAKEYGVGLLRPPREAVWELLGLRGCRPKMLRDIELRRQSEIDYINGFLLQLAAAKGVYTPYNMAVYLAVKGLEDVMKG